MNILYISLLLLLAHQCAADTPANCTLDDLDGLWNFHFTKGGGDRNIDCSKETEIVKTLQFNFHGRNKVTKLLDGEQGHFNLIYNQGFEVLLGHRSMFAFFKYTLPLNSSKYDCDVTMRGWAHDDNSRDWSCFFGEKVAKQQDEKLRFEPGESFVKKRNVELMSVKNLMKEINYHPNEWLVSEINNQQSSWKATEYKQFEKLSYYQMLKRGGYGNGELKRLQPHLKLSEEDKSLTELPRSLDWRNVGGVNYLSPVRNQGNCGSCYAFASMGMLEARMRIATNNTQTPVYSPQYIVSCSRYAQGCDGGFPYLIAGKHAQDFGVVTEECYPYKGVDSTCPSEVSKCSRDYVARYSYVGGYYGGCTEKLMMQGLMKDGPMAVAIQVYEDFMHYKSGIYHHVTKTSPNPFHRLIGYNPFQLTNHAVLLVGWGEDNNTGEKYWIVKNSWGENWGENGFVRIRRGTDEIAIESLAQQSYPIPKLY